MTPKKMIRKLATIVSEWYKERDVARKKRGHGLEAERLKKDFLLRKVSKIHFGCGPRILKGWINIDLHFEPYANYMQYYTEKYYPESIRGNRSEFYAIDIVGESLPFPDNSVDLIFHEDFLEHLDQKEQFEFLAETFRIMKPGAIHRVNTPELLDSMRNNSNFSLGRKGVFIEEWEKHRHKNLITPSYLKEIAECIGYKKVIFNSRDNSISKEIPQEYRPGKNRPEQGNVFADLVK